MGQMTRSSISTQQLQRDLDDGRRLQLVDVRSSAEFSAGHIPIAINIPLEQLESRSADIDTSSTLILVCQSGARAAIAMKMLASRHPDAAVLDGGTKAWIAFGLPTVRTTKSRWSLERQVRLCAGLLILLSVVLVFAVSIRWLYLCGFVGIGLTFAGATDICGMGMLLSKMPWNRASTVSAVPLEKACSVK